MHIPTKDATYDAAYAIESTCHAPNRVGVYSEIYRILKPGGVFAAYEWVMTEKYDSSDAAHVAAKKGIERGSVSLSSLLFSSLLFSSLLFSLTQIVLFQCAMAFSLTVLQIGIARP
jgi:SAM-dependent methyltransferase